MKTENEGYRAASRLRSLKKRGKREKMGSKMRAWRSQELPSDAPKAPQKLSTATKELLQSAQGCRKSPNLDKMIRRLLKKVLKERKHLQQMYNYIFCCLLFVVVVCCLLFVVALVFLSAL